MRTLLLIISFAFAMSFTSCATHVAVKTPSVKVVKVAPKHHKVVVVKGKRYYFWNGRYHKKTRKGYVIVKV
jgi:biopolymer transport protein ExbD